MRRTLGDGGLRRFAVFFPLDVAVFLDLGIFAAPFAADDVPLLVPDDVVAFGFDGGAADDCSCASPHAPKTKQRMIRNLARTRIEELRNANLPGLWALPRLSALGFQIPEFSLEPEL